MKSRLSSKLQFFAYFNLRPKFKAAMKWIRNFLKISKKSAYKSESLNEPVTMVRLAIRSMMTLIITAFSMVVAGALLAYPGGIETMIAQFLTLANQSLGGHVPFQQLLAALGAGLILMIDLTILCFYAFAGEPIQASDVSDQLLEFDDVLEQRFEIVHHTLDTKIIPLLKGDDADNLIRLVETDIKAEQPS